MNYTTPEQSKKLLELGLNPESADLYYLVITDDEYSDYPKASDKETILRELPCWSLGALIDLMPYEIKEDGDTYRLLITHKLAQYPRLTTLWPSLYNSHADSTFEAAYNMMVWLLENKYL